jgi:Family of unknown function (DUF6535)
MFEETTEPSPGPDPDPPPDPPGTPPDAPQPELGDFDDRAAEFWSVYVKEAQRHDEALIGTWKEDMEGVIIFVRSLLPLYIVNLFLTGMCCDCCLRPVYTRPP